MAVVYHVNREYKIFTLPVVGLGIGIFVFKLNVLSSIVSYMVFISKLKLTRKILGPRMCTDSSNNLVFQSCSLLF